MLSPVLVLGLAFLAADKPALGVEHPEAVKLYVSTQGNDSWSGRLAEPNGAKSDGPLASLKRARDAIRALKKAPGGLPHGAVVLIRAGMYSLPETFKLSAGDSGTPDAPIVYRGYQAERPTILGAKPVAGFQPYRGSIVKADVSKQGLKGVSFRQLFFDGRRQHLARWPNFDPENPYGGGWAYVPGKIVTMYQELPDDSKRDLTYDEKDARPWSRPEEGEVFIFPRYNWWNNIVRIKSIDRQARRITLVGDCSYAIRAGDRYYVRNQFEDLDAPGEWYLDRASGTLYFWPPKPLEGKPVYAPHLRTIVELEKGASHVVLRGLTFEGCEGTAVVLREASNCLIAGNVIRNAGDYGGSGVSVSGGKDCGVLGNDIHDIGSNGIALSGGDRKTLTSCGHYAENNYIHHVGVFYKQGVGVAMTGVGCRASRNLIHDGPRMGIMFSGNNLVIEYNHIRHMNLETEDTGAVYTGGRDWISSRGTAIRYNYFHDILGYGHTNGQWMSPHFSWGVYLDDNAGGVDVIGNIVVRAHRAGLHLHNGRDNLIENNIFVDGTLQQVEYSGWTSSHRYWSNHMDTMLKGYESVVDQPAWKGMRNMDIHPSKAVLPDDTIMSGNVLRRNIITYSDPDAKLFNFRNVSWKHNLVDYNLVWHGGLPVKTGVLKMEKTTGPNLLANPGFEEGAAGQMPPKWRWQAHPAGSKAQIDATAAAPDGKQSLRFDAGPSKDPKGNPNMPIIVSESLPIRPGQAFRLSARLKAAAPGVKATISPQSYVANAYFWAKTQSVLLDTQWKEVEVVFQIPTPGQKGFHEKMKSMVARFDLNTPQATIWIDDVRLHEAVLLDEWRSWQSEDHDQHSLVADPLFVDPAKDDYRLRPDSPAFKLGFKPIPVEKIGPYADPLRASWPIVEAEGAREKPLVGSKK